MLCLSVVWKKKKIYDQLHIMLLSCDHEKTSYPTLSAISKRSQRFGSQILLSFWHLVKIVKVLFTRRFVRFPRILSPTQYIIKDEIISEEKCITTEVRSWANPIAASVLRSRQSLGKRKRCWRCFFETRRIIDNRRHRRLVDLLISVLIQTSGGGSDVFSSKPETPDSVFPQPSLIEWERFISRLHSSKPRTLDGSAVFVYYYHYYYNYYNYNVVTRIIMRWLFPDGVRFVSPLSSWSGRVPDGPGTQRFSRVINYRFRRGWNPLKISGVIQT